MAGIHGRYWRFDLSRGAGEFIAIPPAVARSTIGGAGLGVWLLHREGPPGIDPCAPEAPLVFAFAPLVGTPLTTSAKFAVVAKSPLTGLVCDSLSSSHFAIAGKQLGVDALVLVGRCDRPSVLFAQSAESVVSAASSVAPTRRGALVADSTRRDPHELAPIDAALEATELWGRSAAETTLALGARGRVVAIGPAGERGVRFATLSNDGRHAGRGGLGAVMGSKNLKALVVRGAVATSVADPARVRRLARSLRERAAGAATAKYRELGTAANVAAFARVGALPTHNFRGGALEHIDALSAEHLRTTRGSERSSCASCTIGCEHRYATAGGASGGTSVRVEYESLFALGPLCGIADPEAVLEASRRCDALGLDTISAGATIAFAMECGERGLLEGAPRFGDGPAVLALLEAIAAREGLGRLLAEGSRRAALAIGGDALDFAPQVKGMELSGYEPRALQTMALGFAVGARGADHNKSAAYELDFSDRVDRLHGDERAARLALEPEDRAALLDSLVLCKFLRGALVDLWSESAELLGAVTGEDWTAAELRAAARRIVDLRKAYNEREGWQPADDTLPPRLLREPVPDGPVAGTRLPAERLEAMVRSYNLARGWSAEGRLSHAQWQNLQLWDPDPSEACAGAPVPEAPRPECSPTKALQPERARQPDEADGADRANRADRNDRALLAGPGRHA